MNLYNKEGKQIGVLNDDVFEPIKPEPIKIDMSVCIESGIDCEFAYADGDYGCLYGKLAAIADGYFHLNNKTRNTYTGCRPRMNHIHASPDGWDKSPVPDGFKIVVWDNYNNKTNWVIGDSDFLKWENVAMFKVTGIQEGFEI